MLQQIVDEIESLSPFVLVAVVIVLLLSLVSVGWTVWQYLQRRATIVEAKKRVAIALKVRIVRHISSHGILDSICYTIAGSSCTHSSADQKTISGSLTRIRLLIKPIYSCFYFILIFFLSYSFYPPLLGFFFSLGCIFLLDRHESRGRARRQRDARKCSE
jgi:hypothetical protein